MACMVPLTTAKPKNRVMLISWKTTELGHRATTSLTFRPMTIQPAIQATARPVTPMLTPNL